jgi:hypothetical protein
MIKQLFEESARVLSVPCDTTSYSRSIEPSFEDRRLAVREGRQMGATAHTYQRVRQQERRRPQGCRVPPNRAAGVRLTRRGRTVLIVILALALLGALWLTAGRGALAGAKARVGGPVPAKFRTPESVIVGRHDTLWEIASRARPDVDPRITVRRIIDLNSLPDPIVQPGQRLLLPSR